MSRHARLSGLILILAAVLAGGSIGGAFWFRSVTVDQTTARICGKVDKLTGALQAIVAAGVKPPRPGQYGYAYWRDHPDERDSRGAGQAIALRILRGAACDPNSLPDIKTG